MPHAHLPMCSGIVPEVGRFHTCARDGPNTYRQQHRIPCGGVKRGRSQVLNVWNIPIVWTEDAGRYITASCFGSATLTTDKAPYRIEPTSITRKLGAEMNTLFIRHQIPCFFFDPATREPVANQRINDEFVREYVWCLHSPSV